MKRRAVVEIVTKDASAKPQVYLDVVKGGEIVYGVRACGSSLAVARRRAEAEFTALRKYVLAFQAEELKMRLRHGVKAVEP